MAKGKSIIHEKDKDFAEILKKKVFKNFYERKLTQAKIEN